jgi:nitrogen regulatory protein PII
MKRITIILKTSEVMSVRKAACIAGADRIVAHPISHRESIWFPSPHVSEDDELIRLDVMVVDSQSDEVVSAILKTARLGKIEKISQVNAKQPAYSLFKLAA